MDEVVILWRTADGEEHEETWPSVEQFRTWAQGEDLHVHYSAYLPDEDGEGLLIDRGEL